MATKQGYEGQLFVGTAGSTAASQVTNCEDLSYDNDLEKVETTVRGAGTSIPLKSEDPVCLGATITWSMFEKTTDTLLTSILAAARTGALLAIRTKSYSSGTGFDGDCSIVATHEMTLKGASKHNFTATPSTANRDWLPNS